MIVAVAVIVIASIALLYVLISLYRMALRFLRDPDTERLFDDQ